MSNRFDEWELRGGDVTESKLVSMTPQELDEWKLGLLTSANDLVELLNKEVLQLREEKKALQNKVLDLKIEVLAFKIELVELKRPKVREI
jgi:hypothetical protein